MYSAASSNIFNRQPYSERLTERHKRELILIVEEIVCKEEK
jgi:hypothetical protein